MGLRKKLVDIQYGRAADPHNWIRDVQPKGKQAAA
jgi:branched-chain amino acid aminotransferase